MMTVKTIKRKALTFTALAAALALAVYLNFAFSGGGLPSTAASATKQPQIATAVSVQDKEATAEVFEPFGDKQPSPTVAAEEPSEIKNYGEAQLVSVSQDTGSEFFDNARLNRAKARDEALDAIQKTLKNTELSSTEKSTLTQSLTNEVSNITAESGLESYIKAKGFADCVVFLEGDSANVTVMTENDGLTADEVTRIRDVILSKCKGIPAQNITVVEVK